MTPIIPAKSLNLAVMASGRGSNYEAIYGAIKRQDLDAQIKIVISDKANAVVLDKAKAANIPALHINPRDFNNQAEYEKELVQVLGEYEIDLVVLAGYMRLVGRTLLNAYKNRVVNIHPALLPSFPGLQAQKQALDYGVKFSGCTVHIVDEGMDTGPIILQAVVPVLPGDTEEDLSKRILQEEHCLYWQALQLFAQGRLYLKPDGKGTLCLPPIVI